MGNLFRSRRSQITIFIILAIVIVAVVAGYFALRGTLKIEKVPAEFQPVYNYFLSCIQNEAENGARALGDRAGYISPPSFEPGSQYAPFSNQLNFLGVGIPYWYYVSGNGLIKEQVPSKSDMEEQLNKYVEENLKENCDFSDFINQGFEVSLEDVSAKTNINNDEIDVSLNAKLSITKGESSVSVNSHSNKVNSKLGSFYNTALKIYNYEKKNSFLEDYSVDALRAYAPVDGVELTCAPKVWIKNDVDNSLKGALESNVQAVKLSGSYYTLSKQENKYFVQNLQVSDSVNFIYSRNWPTKIEIWNSNNGVLMAEPVGMQQGLGLLGFCYVPYHFVYDLSYPVLIQVYDNNEIFQFPVAVIINKNVPREALPGTSYNSESDLCRYKNQEVSVYTSNTDSEPVEADISFECLKETCDIGRTKVENNTSVFIGNFPQCGNGFIVARANGYAPRKYLLSTNIESAADIILDKLYNLTVDLKVDSSSTSDRGIIIFSSADITQTAYWPGQKTIQLAEGSYNVSVYVYRNSSIIIPATQQQQCSTVPKSGIAGFFGITEEKCFNIDLPSQTIEDVIYAGGKSSQYFMQSQLSSGKVEVSVSSFPVPRTLEDLQNVYNLIEINNAFVDFEK